MNFLNKLIGGRLLETLRPALPRLAIGTLSHILAGLSMLAALGCLVQLLGELSVKWIAGVCVMGLIGGVLASLSSFLCHRAEVSFTAHLRRKMAAHLIRTPAATLSRYGDDKLRRLVSDDVSALHHMIAHLPGEISTFFVIPLVSIVLLVSIAGPAALLALIPGAFTALYYLAIVPRLSARYGKQRAKSMSEIMSAVDDYSRGIRVNRIFGAQTGALTAYRRAAQRFTSGMVAWVSAVATPAAAAIALLQAVSTYAIAYAVSYQQDAAALGAALLFSLAVVMPAMKLGHGLDYVSVGRAAASRLSEFLNERLIPAGDKVMAAAPAALDVNKVEIVAGTRALLKDLNFQFLPGTITAVTGQSGIGKSTLLQTLAGMAYPEAGVVSLGNINIYDLDEDSRHRWIQFIPQGTDLLASSVRENLTLSSAADSDDILLGALKKSQIEIALDVDTKNLSGGERQRIGLARAFLTTATVILLDEPTHALDAPSALGLMTELKTLARTQRKIIVMVTHDTDLVRRVDKHLNLDQLVLEGLSQ